MAFAEGHTKIDAAMLSRRDLELGRPMATRAALPRSWKDVEFVAQSKPPPPRNESIATRLVGQTLAGRYPLLSLLGHGGMGAVYETRGAAGERLAIKVILGDADGRRPDALRRFVREARAVMSITSDHVVKVVDADTDAMQQVPFIVMEHLEGQDLAGLLRNAGALEIGPIARIFAQACRGLSDAHKLGIVHRDIKPANIFLHELPSGEIVAKICDFGVAKKVMALEGDDTSLDLTSTGGVLGSPMYFSPEQARNAKNVDQLTDIWSLAISLYEAVSARRAFESCSSVGEIILAVCTQDVPPLEEVAPWIPSDFAAVVHKGLRRDPTERYASMDEFAAALLPFTTKSTPRRATLIPISHDKRAMVPARSAPAFASTTAHASTVRETSVEPLKRRTSPRLVAAGILAVIVAGGSVILRTYAGGSSPRSTSAASSSSRGAQVLEPPSSVAVVNETAPAVDAGLTAVAEMPRAAPAKSAVPRGVAPSSNRPPPAVSASSSARVLAPVTVPSAAPAASSTAPHGFSNSRTE